MTQVLGPAPGRTRRPAPFRRRAGLLAALAVIGAGLAYRVGLAHAALFMGDEWHTLRSAFADLVTVARTYDEFGSGTGYPLAAKCAALLGGWRELVVRAPALVGGIVAVLGAGWLGRRLAGPLVGVLAAALAATNSFLIYYAAFARAYAVVAGLGVVCGAAALRLIEWGNEPRPARAPAGPLALLAACAALLPWFHLTGLSVLLSIAGATLAALALARAWRAFAATAASVLAGLALAGLLCAPAWEPLREFIGRKGGQKYYGSFGALDVLALHWGNRSLALALVPALALSALWLAWRNGRASLPIVAGLLGPLAALVIVRPNGDPYAYARYAIASVPFACVALAAGTAEVLRRARVSEARTLAAGAVLACLALAAGSYGLRRTEDRSFAATYVSLFPLPAFDRPFPGTPEVYRRIAADERAELVLEVPHLIQRSVHLYRNYALQHGKRVRTGFLTRNDGLLPLGYPTLAEPRALERLGADYLVVHTDVASEVERYWDFVYGELGALAHAPAVRAYMERHERYGSAAEKPAPELLGLFTRAFGAPFHVDADVWVWQLGGAR